MEEPITLLIRKKHELLNELNQHRISDADFQKLFIPLVHSIEDETKKQMEVISQKNLEKFSQSNQKFDDKTKPRGLAKFGVQTPQKSEESKMVDEVKPAKVVKVKEVKPKKETASALVIKALQMKSIKSAKDVVAKVAEWNPIFTEKQVLKAVAVAKYYAKKGKIPYTWNEEAFQLTAKTA